MNLLLQVQYASKLTACTVHVGPYSSCKASILQFILRWYKTKLMSLRARRIQQQLLIMFKMKKGLLVLHFEDLFQRSNYNRTRGSLFKLMIPKSKSKVHREFFTNACVKHWNRLKSSEINVLTCKSFKKNIQKYFHRERIW